MPKYLFILVLSMMTATITGCKDILDVLTTTNSEEPAAKEEIYRKKLKTDLKQLDQIRTTSNTAFIELEDKLKQTAKKNTSTLAVRQELQNFAANLRSQNDQFRVQYFATSEVAKLRNKIMQLNYATIQIIAVIENPNEVSKRLNHYFNQQEKFIADYNKMRAEVETSL